MDSNLPPENNPPPFTGSAATPPPPPAAFNRPPPLSAPSPAPRPSRRGTGWMIFAFILLGLLALSGLLNMGLLFGSGSGESGGRQHSYGPRLEEVTMRDGHARNKIAVIDVEGVIMGGSGDQGHFGMVTVIKEQLRRAKNDEDVKAVLLRVNSPGGEVLASDDIANAITEFRGKAKKPVIVSMGSLAASGGYYVSAPCDWIVANELTITGSIGVIMQGYNYRELLDKVGVQPQVYKSGRFKDMLSGSKTLQEVTPEERKMVQALIDETYQKFKSVVEDGRTAAYKAHEGKKLSADWADLADGRILSGKEAYRNGFVDELGDFDKAVDRAKQLAKLGKGDVHLVQYQPMFDLSNLFQLFGESNAKARTIKVDLGVELPKVKAGCLYFLSSTFLH